MLLWWQCYAIELCRLVVNHSNFAMILILQLADCTMPNYNRCVDKLIRKILGMFFLPKEKVVS